MGGIVKLSKKSYSSARVSVMKSKLYGDDVFKKLSSMSFSEIIKFMEENNFKSSVDDSFLKYEGFYLVERILNDYLSNIYRDINLGSTISNRKLLDEYYLKYQIHNLMVVIRCKLAEEKSVDAYLIGDERKKSKFIKAFEMNNIDDSIEYLCGKMNFDPVEVMERYTKNLFELENYLYRKYYERIVTFKFKFNNRDERDFFKFIRRYVDLINCRSFGKIIGENSNKISFEEIFILGGNLDLHFFTSIKGVSEEEFLKKIRAEFESVMGLEEFSNLSGIDRAIGAHKRKSSKIFGKISFGSPFYSLKYLFEVEKEISRLRILLKGKYVGLDEETIAGMI